MSWSLSQPPTVQFSTESEIEALTVSYSTLISQTRAESCVAPFWVTTDLSGWGRPSYGPTVCQAYFTPLDVSNLIFIVLVIEPQACTWDFQETYKHARPALYRWAALLTIFILFWDRALKNYKGWPLTCKPPASASSVAGFTNMEPLCPM